jgi:hypothetical protein
VKCCGRCWPASGWKDASYDAYRWCMPGILYASTTQARVSPLVSGASKVWSKVGLLAPYCLGYI